ncbi:hypothetical protein DRH29_03870 [candidate division Kazan bacterium]|uniref:Big-1 domain-containing protein n=1 Tax=candidate division Kazan bacterium TaxID=2202143 RepID=A0A420ZC05_UNCK3|nr:MAG: hypothetical protein DRH29_03870 [candidate division Kazan bacterium]
MPTLKIVATLTDVNGNPLSGKTIEFYKSTDNVNFTLIATKTTDTNGEAETTDEITQAGTYYYKARFPGDDTYDEAEVVASYTYSPMEEWIQAFMNLLPWIVMIMIIILIIALLVSALT